MVGLNGTLRLVIPGCEPQFCDFELSLWVGLEQVGSNRQLLDQSIVSAWVVIGVRERYWAGGQLDIPGLMSMLAVWLIYSGMC